MEQGRECEDLKTHTVCPRNADTSIILDHNYMAEIHSHNKEDFKNYMTSGGASWNCIANNGYRLDEEDGQKGVGRYQSTRKLTIIDKGGTTQHGCVCKISCCCGYPCRPIA